MPRQAILFDSRRCSGCLACEVACAFRKVGAFGREGAAIEVAFDALAGVAEATFGAACDLCGPLVTPLCVEYCAPGALALGRR